MPIDESSPLLQFPGSNGSQVTIYGDLHDQFCNLSGVPPLNLPIRDRGKPHPESLYHRALTHRKNQNAIYMFTATLVNTLLLAQVVLGAALTALGASDSSRVLITIFGATNTVIAGLIAFLKSRGQPMRARMFRDDLERVVDEIENSAIMWLGISRNVHGYSAIDTDEQVTVRSEVARLTRLYDRAVKTNTMNDPDMYAAGMITDFHSAALKGGKPAPAPVPVEAPNSTAPVVVTAPSAVPAVNDPDESPATKAATKSPVLKGVPKTADTSTQDESPASSSKPAKAADKSDDSTSSEAAKAAATSTDSPSSTAAKGVDISTPPTSSTAAQGAVISADPTPSTAA